MFSDRHKIIFSVDSGEAKLLLFFGPRMPRARTSSRTREPNDSTNGFCHGEAGSMKLRPAAL
jgi:hypothetical protein